MNQIATVRKKLGVTQSVLANTCGWKQSRVANYESGIRVPDLESCRRIVMALNELGSNDTLDEIFPPKAA
ncbi:XRE family transcriptional regulator [Yersinia entomophaga]|uniref:XRE family transcriptional regulator n=2 Tax=Yersinia TaxID=629 RepID=A0ABM6BQP2_YERET|nr:MULTISPECIES: helix-turn-helix transcriptional regulator [Yersinia]ANI31940.1 XRE family transcriptional regulator [Yersinia entomophaga]OWF84489.1 transcriptional regulator [Yersinia entomophaga]CNF30106.1 XRE family transcriptional regulator [Yersinia nurmii]